MTHSATHCQRQSLHRLARAKLDTLDNADLSSTGYKDESLIQLYYELSAGLRKVRIGRPTPAMALVYLSVRDSRSQAYI